MGASVQGRVALGPRAGARVRRLGDEPDLGHVISRGARQAQLDGFDLHGNVWVPPNNRARLEQLCRYLLRPPLAQDRIRLRADGRVLVNLKTVWRDGTSHFLFERIEFLEKLAALIPRPAVNLLLYHGVLAPRARWRSQVVRYGRPGGHGRIDRLPLLVDFAPLVASVITPCPIPDGCDHNPHIVVIAGVGKYDVSS